MQPNILRPTRWARPIPRPQAPNRAKDVTVCIAGLFGWNYGTLERPDLGRVGILLSDRMITAGDAQYEPQKQKAAQLAPKVLVAIAGDYSIHSQAIKDTHAQLRGKADPHPYDAALIYGRAIQGIKRRQAEDLYLSPLGLNTDTFVAQQKEMSDGLTNALIDRLHSYRGEEVEAIVMGVSQPLGAHSPTAQLYSIDTMGGVSCNDDLGFAAIGIGGWHAKSRLMQSGYTNNWMFADAVATLYAAKKAAEAAPGVGRRTDIQFLMRGGHFELWDNVHRQLERIYIEYEKARDELAIRAVEQLGAALAEPPTESKANAEIGLTREGEKVDERLSAPAPEAAREDEDRSAQAS